MSALPGDPHEWPRRRRMAAYARGSASAGAMPVPVATGKRAELHRQLLDLMRGLPGICTRPGAEDSAEIHYVLAPDQPHAGTESPRPFARITARSEALLTLPAGLTRELSRAGWIETPGGVTRVKAARNSRELEVVWQIIAIAHDFAMTATRRESTVGDRVHGERHIAGSRSLAALAPREAAV